MTQETSGDSATADRRRGTATPLARWEKALAAAAGLVVLSGGGWAVIGAGKDGAGALALIAIGALFLLVGVTGAVPTSFKVGGNEMSLERVVDEWARVKPIVESVRQAQEAVFRGEAAQAQEVIHSLIKPRSKPLAASPTAAQGVQYVEAAYREIPRALPPTATFHAVWRRTEDSRDIGPVIEVKGDQQNPSKLLGVDVKLEAGDAFVEAVRKGAKALRVDGFLVLVERPHFTLSNGGSPSRWVDTAEGIVVAEWRPDYDPKVLRQLVEKLIQIARSS